MQKVLYYVAILQVLLKYPFIFQHDFCQGIFYPIQKQNEGHYTLINFKSSPEFTAELDRIYNITDGVLRSLIVKKEVKPAKAKKAPKQFEAAKAE